MPLGMLGKYERLDILGHGASGIVYLARDTLLNRQVALKEIDAEAGDVRRFLEEARLLDRLHHPNIVRVHSIDRIEGHLVIDMEYVRGKNLAQILREEGSLPLGQALDIAIQVLDALDYAHSLQTVHRDIKPANILVGRDGVVKLVDFGLAEILATNAYAGGAGTYAYMAPEDFSSEDRSDHRSDLWAVGVTLYEMLAGERPFKVRQTRDPFAWKRVLETESPTPVTEYLPRAIVDGNGVGLKLERIFERALARNKQERYATARAFRDDLVALRASLAPELAEVRLQPPPAYPTSTTPNGMAPPQQHPLPMRGPQPMPGTVVAEVVPEPSVPKTLFRRRPRPVLFVADPQEVDFGELRKGEKRTLRVRVLSKGVQGPVQGCVVHAPEWTEISPMHFQHPRQTLQIVADSRRVWETGAFEDRIMVESSAGQLQIPVFLRVLPARPTFRQVAFWFLPLWLLCLSPLAMVGVHLYQEPTAFSFLLPGLCISGLLALSLLITACAADLGRNERVACLVFICLMLFFMGGTASLWREHALTPSLHQALVDGVAQSAVPAFLLGAMLLLQSLHFRKWKLWAVVMACLGLLLDGMLLRILWPST
ncbi:serine/threonine protein kinase [Chthonomonas calidirosea]|uniref:serine/threonine-protein kinase n=2 Tax=Chthonomonas calidirosea TaxID=454171 RepID=UPI0006DD509C|nr:serine/threonine-protein kinase [Chthonomonas calidirosea]CEK12534.1 serine/threonine protein kinase [Chthonomonas calidirosea]CEK12535.1 serine/threonine protein kinase [Chthonomonas calidirosea]